MMDFTSAQYMGMAHSSRTLAPWKRLTTGRPGILHTPNRYRHVAAQLAGLVGCEQAALGPSTLHLFWDLFNILGTERVALYFDSAAYPIARWGSIQAQLKGCPVTDFPHHDPTALKRVIPKGKGRYPKPVIVTDGFCPGCGKSAPIDEYLDIVRPESGHVVIDDTQALGIWGRRPDPEHPYGRSGGGSLRKVGTGDRCIILINSLAKAFGAPLGMIAGSKTFMQRYMADSQTRIHCSPPSSAAVAAAAHALAINANHGNALRRRLNQLVVFFKKQIARIPMAVTNGRFPVQSVKWNPLNTPQRLYRDLQNLGVRAVLNRRCSDLRPQLSFLITIRHTFSDIFNLIQMLAAIAYRHGLTKKIRRWDDAL